MDGNFQKPIVHLNQAKQYRSAGLASEYFSRVGNVHMHVDGGVNAGLVRDVLRSGEVNGELGKMSTVIRSVAGPQRDELPDTYASHTPGAADAEQFDYFATIHLGHHREAVRRVHEVVSRLANTREVVIEVEQVVARMDDRAPLSWLPTPHEDSISSDEVGYERDATLPFEIHHGFDLPVGARLSVESLLQETTQLGVTVGGWFVFAREDRLSYRSNSFCDSSVGAVVTNEHDRIRQFLSEMRLECPLRSVVEKVLGVWRTPARPISS